MDNVQINQELQNLLEQARRKTDEISEEYKKFSTLREELQTKSKSIKTFHSGSENKNNEILKFFESIKSRVDEIEKIKNRIDELNKEVDSYYLKFVEIRKKLDDEDDGLETSYDWVKNKKEESNKKYEEIVQIFTSSDNLKKEIEKFKIEVEEIKKTSDGFKDSIKETLDLVTASSLTHEFGNRKAEIQKNVRFWKWFLIIALVILIGSIMFIYYIQAKYNGFTDWRQWYRYLFSMPVIYLVYLSSKNYNTERDLLEKYSFKAVLSTSLKAYIKLLNDHFEEKRGDILTFTLTSMGIIYKEPYIEKDKKKKLYFGIKNIFNVGVEDVDLSRGTSEVSDSDKEGV